MDERLLSKHQRKTFRISLLDQSKGQHNHFLPAGAYPNTVPGSLGVYDMQCPSVLIAFPLIRRQKFSSMKDRKAKQGGSKSYFGPQCLFEHQYPETDTYNLDDVPTAKQLMFTLTKGEYVLIVDQVWVAIYPTISES